MNEYRQRLYADYSTHFNQGKVADMEFQAVFFRQLYPNVLPASKSAKILDAGCGKGDWLRWLQSLGYTDLTGVDLCAEDLAVSENDGIATKQMAATDFLRTQQEAYDVIHAKDMIEHLTKDEAVDFCVAANGALKKGGVFWLTTYNAQAPLSSATRFGDFTHEIGLTPSSAHQLMKACGFSEVSVRGIHIGPKSLKGRIRKRLYQLVNGIASFIIDLRHGKQTHGFQTCLPDLFILAKK